MRLIDSNELKEWVKNWFEKHRYYHPHSKANDIPITELYDLLEQMPTVDAEPVVHGENIGEDYAAVDQFVCSKCGIELQGWYRVERDMDDGEETNHEYTFHYCPNCGAKMDGGADE